MNIFRAGGGADTCCFNVQFTNNGPFFVGGCGETEVVSAGDTKTHTVAATDDCDPFTFYIADVTPTPKNATGSQTVT